MNKFTKIITIILLSASISLAASTFTTTGKGETAGEAYMNAMAKAPDGNNWKIVNVSKMGGNGQYYCTVQWKSN